MGQVENIARLRFTSADQGFDLLGERRFQVVMAREGRSQIVGANYFRVDRFKEETLGESAPGEFDSCRQQAARRFRWNLHLPALRGLSLLGLGELGNGELISGQNSGEPRVLQNT